MIAHIILNLLNKLGKKIRYEALPNIFQSFPTCLIHSITGARMQDSSHYMTLTSHLISNFHIKTSKFRH